MPGRKSVWPGNAKSDRRKEPKPQAVFADVYEDPPSTQIPATALCKAINGWPTGTAFRPRNGSKLFGSAYPAIEGRTGYAAHKTGDFIISDSGNIFTAADVSNLWVWDNGLTDEMTEYIDAQTVRVRDNDANTGTACHIQGKLNLNQWHDKQEIWILQLGQDFYTADRDKLAYTKVHIFGRNLPANAISEMVQDGDDALVQNARYMYRIQLTKNPIRAYPTNTPIPTVRIESNDDLPEKNHQYRYLYSAGLLESDGNFIHRETPTKIMTETGTNQIDENRRDWALRNTEDQIGPRSETYGVLTGAALPAGTWDSPSNWTGIADATFRININGLGVQEIVVDFSMVATMNEMAERIQTSLQYYFPSATCKYEATAASGGHFVITSGLIKNGSVSYATDGLTGTNAAINLRLTAVWATPTTPYLGIPHIIRGLYLPLVKYIPGTDYQWHHSHYHIYRTPDTGPTGMQDGAKKESVYYSHLNERGKRIVNSPDEFVWNKDLRAAAAFIARRINGTIELYADEFGGEFELADEGSVVEFEDGSRVEISETGFINSKLVLYNDADYYNEETPWMAACIGNGKAVRVTKTGTIIARRPGSDATSYTAFTADDERRPIWYPNGVKDYIKTVIDADTIEVYGDYDLALTHLVGTAISYAPRYRNYCDAVYDEQLFSRASAWYCKNRFMREVLPSNSIIKQPGFVIMAARGGKDLQYCPLESSYKMFLGYHNREFQTIELEDVIERLCGFTNRYAALCKGAIFSGATNNSIEYTIPETFQKIWILSGAEKVSSVGIISYGSLEWVDDDWVRFVTNTGELRDFNGFQFREDGYGPLDYSEDKATGLGRFKLALKKAYKEFNAKYARGVGYILWWKENE